MLLKTFMLAVILFIGQTSFSQSKFKHSHTAVAKTKYYKAVYYINDSSAHKIKGTLQNIKNALEDPRLEGRLQVELVAFGDGVELFKKINKLDTVLLALQKKGVVLIECLNTIKAKNINKDELWPFISYVPTGNGEVIIKQAQGWSVMHP